MALVIGGVIAVALVAADVVLTLANTRLLHTQAVRVAHSYEVIWALNDVRSAARDAETGQRGFLIAGEPDYLAPYHAAVGTIDQRVNDLERLVADDAEQLALLPDLRNHINAKFQELEQTVDLRLTKGFDAARQVVMTDRGKAEMEGLRAVVSSMIQLELDRLRSGAESSLGTYRQAVLSAFVSGVAALAAIGAFLILLRKHLAARAEATFVIAEQGERLRTTLASIGDGVITTDTRGCVTNLNAVAEELTGWTNADALGMPLEAVWRIVNEETREPTANPAAIALKEGRVVGLANHTVLIAKDGTERPIDDSAAPIHCAEGQIVGVVLVFRDVSKRREGDRQLQEREKRFSTLADSIPQLAWIANADGAMFWFNRRWHDYTGTTIEQAEGAGWHSVHDPDVLPSVLEKRAAAIVTGQVFDMVFPLRARDGTFRSFLTREVPVTDEQGRVIRWVGTATDVTEQQRMEEQLRGLAADLSEADHRKDEFLSILAHELRNPLAPLRNGLEIMRLSKDDGASITQTRAMMERQLAQMIHLVDDLLDVSRVSRGQLELRKQRIELATVVNNAVETSRPLIESGGHTLTLALPPQPLFIDGDATRLAQVFANLLNNAAKYSEPGGHIKLVAEQAGDEVIVSVIDTGVGIPVEMLPKVFDMFTQVDRSLEKSQSGLGIGLNLVKRLVEMHDGTVAAHSEGRGKGSQFVVRLPIVAAADREGEKGQIATSKAAAPGRRILVADDNVDSAASLAMMLEIMGYKVWAANDGLEALHTAEKVLPDIILMDIGMPKLNGYEACRRIRAQPWGKHIVVVAMTGWGHDDNKRRSDEVGFDHHLVKPVDPTDLEKVLAQACKN